MHANPQLAPERSLALDARMAIYGRAAASDRLGRSLAYSYPTQYVSRWRMKGGEEILIRPIRPEDAPLMARFHQTLSAQRVYLRSLHMQNAGAPPAHERLIGESVIDYSREMSLVAERSAPEAGQHEIVAVGRLSKAAAGKRAEVSVQVSDRYQRHGLGSELVRRLIQVSRDEKLQEIAANVPAENLRRRALAERFGFRTRASDDPTVQTAVLDLSKADVKAASHHA